VALAIPAFRCASLPCTRGPSSGREGAVATVFKRMPLTVADWIRWATPSCDREIPAVSK
jgi:hypothetical protein